MSARPLAPPPATDAPRPRRRWWPIVAAAVVLALVGASAGVYLKQRQEPVRPPTTRQSSAPPARADYFVPVSIGLDAAGTATLTWDPANSGKPGFEGFFVMQFEEDGDANPVTRVALPGTTGTYSVTLRPGRRECFGVLAYGVTDTPLTPVPQACVTPR
jgi:hypothetical protein